MLDDDGLAAPGEIIRPGDIYINKESPVETRGQLKSAAALADMSVLFFFFFIIIIIIIEKLHMVSKPLKFLSLFSCSSSSQFKVGFGVPAHFPFSLGCCFVINFFWVLCVSPTVILGFHL